MLVLLSFLFIMFAVFVVTLRNTIYSLFSLVMVYTIGSSFLIYLGAEFLGLTILIVYIGAISVLFLFVVMLLNIKFVEVYVGFSSYLPLGFLVIFIFFLGFKVIVFHIFFDIVSLDGIFYLNWLFLVDDSFNVIDLGLVLYNYFGFYLLLAGALLFFALVGALVILNFRI